jgi:hypothetical protein
VKHMTDLFSNCSELAREKMWSRLHITPLLQAEEDRDQVRRHFADQARANELLGSGAKVYNSDRYVGPIGVLLRAMQLLGSLLILFCVFLQLCPPYFRLYPRQCHSIDCLTMSLVFSDLQPASLYLLLTLYDAGVLKCLIG